MEYPGISSQGATIQLNNLADQVHQYEYDPRSDHVYLQQRSQAGPIRSSLTNETVLGSQLDESRLPLPNAPENFQGQLPAQILGALPKSISYSSPNRYPLREISPNTNQSVPVKSISIISRGRSRPYPCASFLPRPTLRQASIENFTRKNSPQRFGDRGFNIQLPLQPQVTNLTTADHHRQRQNISYIHLTQQNQHGLNSSKIPRYVQPEPITISHMEGLHLNKSVEKKSSQKGEN